MYISQFVYSWSIDEHVSCFQFGVITNEAATDICLQDFVMSLG